MKIVLASEGAKMPTKAHKSDAGFDLYVSQDAIIKYGRNIVPTGLKMAIDEGWEGHIRPRSGYASKGIEGYYIVPDEEVANTKQRMNADVIQGTIDSLYRGEVGIIVKSNEPLSFKIEKGTRIAQIVFERCYIGELEQVDELDDTERGEGGFGSSGAK